LFLIFDIQSLKEVLGLSLLTIPVSAVILNLGTVLDRLTIIVNDRFDATFSIQKESQSGRDADIIGLRFLWDLDSGGHHHFIVSEE
jgi:hypothetical protein